MTVQFVPTPLGAPPTVPEPRPGGVDPALLPAFAVPSGHEALLDRLRAPNAVVLTTGQQPALFTGPLYTVHKAASAAALAALLEERWSRPVVPVFWVAGDDHDFAEANHAWWIAADGTVAGASLPPRPPEAPLTPMYRELLGPTMVDALAALERDLPPSEFRADTLSWLGRHFRPEATVAGSYRDALAELLAPLGVVTFDSTHPAVKRAAAPLLLRALRESGGLESDLAALAEGLAADGTDSGMTIGVGATLVMLDCRLGRDRLMRQGDRFTTRRGKASYSLTELEALAAKEPERFSPNVLLRPVVESALLPTVAYLGGPGELRYLALTPPVYRRLGITRQRPLPRWSGVLVEPRVTRVMEKFGVTLEELMQPPGPLETRLVRSQLPADVLDALASLRSAIDTNYEAVVRRAADIDPTLTKPVQGVRHQALAGTHDIEKKLIQHLKKREETELAQLARARTAVWPQGKPQERLLTFPPFLARYGPTLLTDLRGAIREWYAEALEGAPAPA
ncbi:MAG TPA: bacillithiol biosynthesis cysteine-adding enzyme BshC [Gemmatimonadales bacterium]|nr:bacillithiol biosynthesis cysteine-adding enzyme BshC [Gemmatimonadales bacterium]